MNRASPAHVERARRVLELEGATGSAAQWGPAAGRVHDKLHAHLDPLLGVAGVQALLVRSARLAAKDGSSAESALSKGTGLAEWLEAQDDGAAAASAIALFGTFFALIGTFIGDRLTSQLLRNAWPTLEDVAPKETDS